MNMQQLSDKMDKAVEALLETQSRDQAEAVLIRTCASLLQKLEDRDATIRILRVQNEELFRKLAEYDRGLDDGK